MMTCEDCNTRTTKPLHGGYSMQCLTCAAALVIAARPCKPMQEAMLYALTRRKGTLNRDMILAAVKGNHE